MDQLRVPLLFYSHYGDPSDGPRKNPVVGYGIGYRQRGGITTDELCLIVYVTKKITPAELLHGELRIQPVLPVTPETVNQITESTVYCIHCINEVASGIPTDVQVASEPRFDASAPGTYTGYFRPVVGGISISWKEIETGTLGCFVRDRKSGEIYLLTAAHVLGRLGQATQKDVILQPGHEDGGGLNATLSDPAKAPDYYYLGN